MKATADLLLEGYREAVTDMNTPSPYGKCITSGYEAGKITLEDGRQAVVRVVVDTDDVDDIDFDTLTELEL